MPTNLDKFRKGDRIIVTEVLSEDKPHGLYVGATGTIIDALPWSTIIICRLDDESIEAYYRFALFNTQAEVFNKDSVFDIVFSIVE